MGIGFLSLPCCTHTLSLERELPLYALAEISRFSAGYTTIFRFHSVVVVRNVVDLVILCTIYTTKYLCAEPPPHISTPLSPTL